MIDFHQAWLLLDIIHKSVDVPEAKAIADAARAQLVSLTEVPVVESAPAVDSTDTSDEPELSFKRI